MEPQDAKVKDLFWMMLRDDESYSPISSDIAKTAALRPFEVIFLARLKKDNMAKCALVDNGNTLTATNFELFDSRRGAIHSVIVSITDDIKSLEALRTAFTKEYEKEEAQ